MVNTNISPLINVGPMTRARACRLRESLQAFVQATHKGIGAFNENQATSIKHLFQVLDEQF